MRRIAAIAGSVLAAGAVLVASAGADDNRTYEAELFNAFGLVTGSELRIAGVNAGTITELDITPEKTALVTFEVDPEFPELKADASCSSEPQSLIAEYFMNCQPGSSPDPLEGPIEAARNQTTVQNDLVQNTLREPFNRRFQLIINEFGTALVGNAENLNAAIRSGAPALRELSEVLKILGRQNTTIAQLNADSDLIFQKLTDRREDVVRFIDEAEDTARVSAERRVDLAANFDLLDDFLFELKPVMSELGNLARAQTPLLRDLGAAAPGLNKLGKNLPKFNDATRVSLEALGNASEVGNRALSKADDEIADLNVAAQKAFPAADETAKFLESIDDPANAVEEDCDARFDLRDQPGEADRRQALLENKIGSALTGSRAACGQGPGVGNPGYTGLEGLLNYAYVQTLSTNIFDASGHGLHINIVGASNESEGDGACGHYAAGPDLPRAALFGGGRTNDIREAAHCVGALGDYAYGISDGAFDPGTGLATGLRRYDDSVCPDGSTRLSICDPAVSNSYSSSFASPGPAAAQAPGEGGLSPPEPDPETEKILDQIKEGKVPSVDEIRDELGLPPGAPLPPEIGAVLGQQPQGQSASAPSDPARTFLDFLFAP